MIHLHPPRRAALTQQYTAWLSRPKCSHTRRVAIDNRTGSTSCSLTRWRDQHTSDKVGHYSIYRPRKDERLSWPSRLTYSGRLTHISGHPSAIGRAKFGKVCRSTQFYLQITPYLPLLPSRRTSPPFGWYSLEGI